jgi:hypothetical protein
LYLKVVASEAKKRKKIHKVYQLKKIEKKKKREEDIPDHGGEEKELRREEKKKKKKKGDGSVEKLEILGFSLWRFTDG